MARRPSRQYSHVPQLDARVQDDMVTDAHDVTPSPTDSTTPAPSEPTIQRWRDGDVREPAQHEEVQTVERGRP